MFGYLCINFISENMEDYGENTCFQCARFYECHGITAEDYIKRLLYGV